MLESCTYAYTYCKEKIRQTQMPTNMWILLVLQSYAYVQQTIVYNLPTGELGLPPFKKN